ncbi:hypothetical protein LTSEURB_2353, partial [Salmonella enterica subsp. enterica serovar Urbana str. R8-2977]
MSHHQYVVWRTEDKSARNSRWSLSGNAGDGLRLA